jgi:hypothetical protein
MTVADKLDGLSVLTRSCQALTGLHICQFFLALLWQIYSRRCLSTICLLQ